MNDVLGELSKWYVGKCNGSWEHQYGVCIETIDNPGWKVVIDLCETTLLQRNFEELTVNRSETDWVRCRVRDGQFQGFGGAVNLQELLMVFVLWSK